MNQTIKTRIEQIGRGKVPEGYKKTKVGIVPSDWGESKLKDISTHVTKKNIDNHIHLTFTNSATQGVIKQTDYFDKEIANQENTSGYYIVEKNDYIYNPRISVSAPCGPINQSHFEETGIVSPLYTVFKMKQGYEENRYFEFYFKSSYWYKYMQSVANYGARHDRMNITNDDLFGMPIPMPAAEERERIAEILGTQDKLIALKEKRIAEKKQQKKYLMQQLLTGKKRLPGFTGEWGRGQLKELTNPIDRRAGIKKYEILSISAGIGFVSQSEKFGKEIAGEQYKNYTVIKQGEFSYNKGNSKKYPQGCIYPLEDKEIAAVPNVFISFSMNQDKCYYGFYKYLFEMGWLNRQLYKYINSGVRNDGLLNLYDQDFFSCWVPIPNIEEQIAIANRFFNIDKEIELLQKDLEEEKNKKKALTQLLLTGIVRVQEEG